MLVNRRDVILGMLGAVAGPAFAGRSGARIAGGLAFGSSWRVTTDESADLVGLTPVIKAVIAKIDRQMSPYRASSDLSAFNASRAQGWQPMPRALCHVATHALRFAVLTDGAFDPTVGPVVSRFGFGPIKGGFGHYSEIATTATALRKTTRDLTLDLCGIAKGYALDRITQTLSDAGISNALVELGGEVKALGQHPAGRRWSVAIADPRATRFRAHRIVDLKGFALATSGRSANGISGPLATSHIIDPHQGKPALDTLESVSVLAPTAMEADALATALCAAGPDRGVRMARRLDIAALFVMTTAGGLTDRMTGRFAHHVQI